MREIADDKKRKAKELALELKDRRAKVAAKGSGSISVFWKYTAFADVTTYPNMNKMMEAHITNNLDANTPYVVKGIDHLQQTSEQPNVKSNVALFVNSLSASEQAPQKIKAQCPLPSSIGAALAPHLLAAAPARVNWDKLQPVIGETKHVFFNTVRGSASFFAQGARGGPFGPTPNLSKEGQVMKICSFAVQLLVGHRYNENALWAETHRHAGSAGRQWRGRR